MQLQMVLVAMVWLTIPQKGNGRKYATLKNVSKIFHLFSLISVFTSITPRAKMLCGLMNVEIGKEYEGNITHLFDIPVFDFAAKQAIASVDTVIRKGMSVIVIFETYGKLIKNRVNVDNFKYIKVQLVDMMLQPVQLLSPIFENIKMKPCKTHIALLKG